MDCAAVARGLARRASRHAGSGNGPRGHVAEQLGQDIGRGDPCPIVAGKKVLRLERTALRQLCIESARPRRSECAYARDEPMAR